MKPDIVRPRWEYDEPIRVDPRRQSRAPMPHPDRAKTLEEIGVEMGITRERVRQLECRALKKAKAILERRGFRLEDWLW